MPKKAWILLLCFALLAVNFGDAPAQGVVSRWLRYDVKITIRQNSEIDVEEIQEVVLVSGATSFEKVVPFDKIEGIKNLTVLQINPDGSQRTYQAANSGAEYTFQVVPEPGRQVIRLFFPPYNLPSTKFVLRYAGVGALRFYDSGDRFDWRPFGTGPEAPVESANIVINLPGQFNDAQIIRSSTGVGGVNNYLLEGNKAMFVAANVPAGSPLEVSVTLPHGVIQGSPPAWQQEMDALEFWSPVLNWGSVITGLLAVLLGLGGVWGWWRFKLRVSPRGAGKIPKYYKSPPGNLSPGVAGALLDGKVQPRHVLAVLLDLAYRGALNVEGALKDPDSLLPDEDVEPVFNLYAVDQEKATRPYETALFGKVFGFAGAKKRKLADIRKTLFMSVPELKKQLEFEIAKAGFFNENVSAVRRQHLAFGGAGILMSFVLGVLLTVLLSKYTYLAGCPFLGIMLASFAFMAVGFAAPRKTETGAQESARWQAFKRYLQDMGVKEAGKVRPRFGLYLPYAVAFGLEESLVKKFVAANVSIPKWWGKPEEKLPNISHDQAHAWVSSGYMAETTSPPAQKSGIRRLGSSTTGAGSKRLLKDIEPTFLAFLRAGHEIFTKAPLEETEQVDLPVPEQS